MTQIQSSNRYVLYRQIKQQPSLEMYFTFLDRKVFRDIYIKFRMGVSELYCHKFRFREDSHSRLCPSCKENEEDDVHLLLECPAYEDLRSKYIRFIMTPVPITYTSLLTSGDMETVRAVSVYLLMPSKGTNVHMI